MDWTVYRDFPLILEEEWNRLLDESITNVPFLRFEYLQIWWQNRGGGEWKSSELAITIGRKDGQLIGIAPLFITKDPAGFPVLMLLGSIEISDYLDLIVRPEDLSEFCEGLFDYLNHEDFPIWRDLEWYNILNTSPTLEAIQKIGQKKGNPVQVIHLQHSPYIPLPGNFDEYLAGIDKKQRHEIRRKVRRAEEADRNVKWVLTQNPETLEEYIDEFLKLMEFDDQKKMFLTAAMRDQFRQTIRWSFSVKMLHLVFLEIDGQMAAAHFCFDYQNRLWAYNSGINPQFNELSPGWVLLGLELRWANENGYTEYDFMRGDEEYKYRFGAVDRKVVRVSMGRKSSLARY